MLEQDGLPEPSPEVAKLLSGTFPALGELGAMDKCRYRRQRRLQYFGK